MNILKQKPLFLKILFAFFLLLGFFYYFFWKHIKNKIDFKKKNFLTKMYEIKKKHFLRYRFYYGNPLQRQRVPEKKSYLIWKFFVEQQIFIEYRKNVKHL